MILRHPASAVRRCQAALDRWLTDAGHTGDLGERNFAYGLAAMLLISAAVLEALVTLTTPAWHTPHSSHPHLLTWTASGIALVLGVLFALLRRVPHLWPLVAGTLLSALLIAVTMALGGAVTFSGQLLLVWPVLYASAALPGWAAWLTALTSVLAYGYVVAEANNAGGATWLATAIWLVGTTLVGIALRRRAELFAAALRRQALTDVLTGLANRRAVQDYFDHVTGQDLGPDDDLAVLVIDVDYFKLINDRHGHVAGDQTLERLGHLIASCVRAGDFAARIGGEEFALMMPGCDRRSAGERAEDLRAAVEGRSRASWPHPVTVSIGVAVARAGSVGAFELLAVADTALYRAKEAGRNTVRQAPPEP